ncbi:CLUMA_CG010326, isoform A [Clunio marinus]|uniref:CLUMA_CG010326, isoform A n=1 Tax=Clunio marinus TaxID=568069 RepID=A0A1J1I9N1_9DIPT|nr:CLUMA_CG010326, isoform A [Clunio marinus]
MGRNEDGLGCDEVFDQCERSIMDIFTEVYEMTFNEVNMLLVVPPTAPTRHQLISGIGIPLQLKDEAITFGMVMKAQYYLPETANQLKFGFFPDIFENVTNDANLDNVWHPFPDGRKRRETKTDPISGQKYESYEGKVEVKGDETIQNDEVDDDDEFDDQFEEDILERQRMDEQFKHFNMEPEPSTKTDEVDFSSSRWAVYDALSFMLESKGFNGRVCVLRAICESAEVEFSEHLMGELFHVFFTCSNIYSKGLQSINSPSTTAEAVSKLSDYDYIEAEKIGRTATSSGCDKVFHQCERSIMEIFTEVFESKMF